ncbi:hypothetical protein DIE04_19060 [Burkholderia sp. Bp8994]|uniref:hypothetical protein n=1 Tax=Burkholderia sp. Bp8994 TaxID=2184555 RepID=UPI000F597FE5|nr:hypothetical protein [Burkholderia sp. Bp8994]RQR94554.1 hypothetical protein DIE04_19060 [Burkholderia sp. Bp8994]
MTIIIDQQTEQAQWVSDVRMQLDKLNKLLASAPEGVDVEVTTGKYIAQVGVIAGFDDADEVWQISVRATKTETLI